MDAGSDPRHLFAASNDHETMVNIVLQARVLAQVVRCAALFSLAEHLEEPTSAEEIAKAEGLDPATTFRLLRACVAFGLVKIDTGKYCSTPLLRTLRRDDPSALRDIAICQEGWGRWIPWSRLDRAIRTGQAQAETALGAKLWDYYASPDGAEEGAAFSRSMAGMGAAFEAEAIDIIDTDGVGLAADIGGATGSFLLALARRNTTLRGVVLDLPHVEPSAIKRIETAGVSDRISFAAGDFMKEVPAADLYLLRWILHDWPDEACLTILQACRRAANPGAKLVLGEVVIDNAAPEPIGIGLDLSMLLSFGSKERTLEEFGALLDASGFQLERCRKMKGPFSIIEASLI